MAAGERGVRFWTLALDMDFEIEGARENVLFEKGATGWGLPLLLLLLPLTLVGVLYSSLTLAMTAERRAAADVFAPQSTSSGYVYPNTFVSRTVAGV